MTFLSCLSDIELDGWESMNPARSLGPAVLAGDFSGLWIYLTAPFLGMLLASPACRLIQGSECCAVIDAEKE
jgi:glycerol uptake facilitator-like aquaporin